MEAGVQHCYGCGIEKPLKGFKDIERMVISSKHHWRKHKPLPYNWHTLTEEQKWKALGMNH
jgi:hypothetical protein